MSQPSAKKARTAELQIAAAAPAGAEVAGDEASPPTEAIRCLTCSGYLPINDMGRLLLLVSRNLASSIFDDAENDKWKCLCRGRWGSDFLSSLESSNSGIVRARGWEWVFRNLSWKEGSTPDVPPLKFPREGYSFIISIYDGKPRRSPQFQKEPPSIAPIACQLVEGDNAMSLLTEGKTGWVSLDHPVEVTKCFKEKKFLVLDLRSTTHAIRSADQKCLPLENMYEFIYAEPVDYVEGEKPGRFSYSNTLHTATDFQAGATCKLFNDDTAGRAVTVAFKHDLVCTSKDTDPKGRIFLVKFSVNVYIYFDGDEEYDFKDCPNLRPGVTLSHILEHLGSWE